MEQKWYLIQWDFWGNLGDLEFEVLDSIAHAHREGATVGKKTTREREGEEGGTREKEDKEREWIRF